MNQLNQLSWWLIMIPWVFVSVVLILSATFSIVFFSALWLLTHGRWFSIRNAIPILTFILTCSVLIFVSVHTKYTDVPKNWFSRLPVQEARYMQQAILRQQGPMTMAEYAHLHDHFEQGLQSQIITRQQQLHWAGLPQQPAIQGKMHPES